MKPDAIRSHMAERQLRAAVELGQPVRAVVKPLSDEQLVITQGQENNKRKDLSFIERAIFAAQLEGRSWPRDDHGGHVRRQDRISRLISSAVRIPRRRCRSGAKDRAGSRRTSRSLWKVRRGRGSTPHRVRRHNKASDERFNALFQSATAEPGKKDKPTIIKSDDGTRVQPW